ncbi:hypothetical protein MJO28_004356 [Puccinia striiformis f. sp. tritici]|uniref:Uncharacterized protein n=3 Tax=Puccinia striiformis TaxID=27350 RepID=A0A2S4VBX1_9BASI|nr:hypothetical protein Pst134EA_017955 [Puccinia striiformis f. sp. tritici]KAI9616029.1 hypothetical protein H4Q26_011281 [Puccinia striiformis f. sp. tritici PST-130]POW07036.1 hypothetical protein PSTT_08567 [Puccinia striiformis]KAH9451380.1 hypothetical protein Pst134EB_018851 [Puccinia striiformis f. sp. tritici]KAH9461665.1 hypothetical protein Pst134EA_017955 [Puccinia striiformis f. sp. tritici]KAI7933273.1 hypothetical protein MJO28_017745 [Puccinia striiformis f. sp. tritici]
MEEIDWFDCSQNTKNKNEECLNILFEIIDTPLSLMKTTKNRDSGTPEPGLELIPKNESNYSRVENEKAVNTKQDEDRNKLPSILRDSESVRYVIIFKHLQHLSVINVLSSLVNEINAALSNFNFRQHNHHPLIQLIGFPVNLSTQLISKFKVRRLSCFAILDSATGVERLSDFFKA